jgi:hypothetical protein
MAKSYVGVNCEKVCRDHRRKIVNIIGARKCKVIGEKICRDQRRKDI